jgi:acyl-CoA synthetase (AMP-forming)/AMP-acid ligase II
MIGSRPSQYPTFADVLTERAADQPDSLAFVFLGRSGQIFEQVTYCELQKRVLALAAAIQERGYVGRNLLLALPTSLDFVVALFACFRAGAVAIPVPSVIGPKYLQRASGICRNARPAAVFACGDSQAEVSAWALDGEGLPVPFISATDTGQPTNLRDPNLGKNDVAVIQYTSGSTANPKGVMLTHGNLLANSQMIAEAFGHDKELRGVGWLPLFHDMGLIGHVLQPVYVGGLSVLLSPLSFIQRPIRWLEAISKWRATTSGGPSHAYGLCADKIAAGLADGLDLSSWRVAYCGSEPVRVATLHRFADRFSVNGFRRQALQPCYGLAEATLLATSCAQGEGIHVVGCENARPMIRNAVSCGRPWSGGEVTLIDPDSGETVAEGCAGEICVSGPHIAAGYWDNPAETQKVFCRQAPPNGQISLRTGDVGFLRNGELFVTGRLKNTIIVFGEKHAAEDIEASVSLSDPLFHGASGAAFAISRSASDAGEEAIVVQEIGLRHADTETLLNAERNAAAAVLRDHSLRVSDIVLVRSGTLARTSSGKIRRAACRDAYQEESIERLNPRSQTRAVCI